MKSKKWRSWPFGLVPLVALALIGLAVGGVGTAQAKNLWNTVTHTTTGWTTTTNPTCPSGTAAVMSPNLSVSNGYAVGTGVIAPGCNHIVLSVATYTEPSAAFTLPQDVYQSDTNTFKAGDHVYLKAKLPDCFYQADFVLGTVIDHLDSNHLYGNRQLVPALHGGQDCHGTTTTTETTTTTPIPTGHGHMKVNKTTTGGDFVPGIFKFTLMCIDTSGHVATIDVTLEHPFFEWEDVSCKDGEWVSFVEHVTDGWKCLGDPNPDHPGECRYITLMVHGGVTWNITNEKVTTTTTTETTTTTTTTTPTTTTTTTTTTATTTTSTPPCAPQISQTKSADSTSVAPGGAISFTVNVTNSNTCDATNVVLHEHPQAGLTITNMTVNGHSCVVSSNTCSVGFIGKGATVQIKVTAAPINTAGTYRNCVGVSSNTTAEANVPQACASVTVASPVTTTTTPPTTTTTPAPTPKPKPPAHHKPTKHKKVKHHKSKPPKIIHFTPW